MPPSEVTGITQTVRNQLTVKLGIHTHDDIGLGEDDESAQRAVHRLLQRDEDGDRVAVVERRQTHLRAGDPGLGEGPVGGGLDGGYGADHRQI